MALLAPGLTSALLVRATRLAIGLGARVVLREFAPLAFTPLAPLALLAEPLEELLEPFVAPVLAPVLDLLELQTGPLVCTPLYSALVLLA